MKPCFNHITGLDGNTDGTQLFERINENIASILRKTAMKWTHHG